MSYPPFGTNQTASGAQPVAGSTLTLGFRAISSGTTDTANLASDYTISWQSTTATKTQTIPGAAAGNKGSILNIADGNKTAGAGNPINITPSSGTVNGSATLAITVAGSAFTIQSDGVSNWVVI